MTKYQKIDSNLASRLTFSTSLKTKLLIINVNIPKSE